MEATERMTPYILIIIILFTTGVSVTTQEFKNEITCRTAKLELLHNKEHKYYQVIAKCVKK